MKRKRHGTKTLLFSMALLALSACGGNESGKSTTPSCTGAAQELFAAMQGSYYGLVSADHSTGSALPLTKGQQYLVTVSSANCAVNIVADKGARIGFSYGDPDNGSLSTLTGLSPSEIIKNPTQLDLTGVQYNIGVSGSKLAYELERRAKAVSADDSVADGDLFLFIYGLTDSTSNYGLEILANTKR